MNLRPSLRGFTRSLCGVGRIFPPPHLWQSVGMQSALLFVLLPFAVLVIGGGIVALNAFRNAPEGHEDAEGFHFGARMQPARVQATGEEPLKLAA